MGIKKLRETDWYNHISTCIPSASEVQRDVLFDEYQMLVKPRYRNILGTMVDYGVRSRHINRCYSFVEIGLAKGITRDYLSQMVDRAYLDYKDAYSLATFRNPERLSSDIACDYAVLVERCESLVKALRLTQPHFGEFYDLGKEYGWIECDCASLDTIVDMKVTSYLTYNREYWTQILLYSLLAKLKDGYDRRRLVLLYPVQGVAESFVYERQDYAALFKSFRERSGL